MVWQPRYQPQQGEKSLNGRLSEKFSIALLYHDIFDYALRESELVKWQAGGKLKLTSPRPRIETHDGYFFLRGRERLISERLSKENISREKMKLLSGVKYIFEKLDDVLMVGVTGSLAMTSAKKDSDIDLMLVVRKGRLWMTRARVLFLLLKHKVAIRRAREEKEQDRLCLNIWMDETDLAIGEPKNAYTAHELAQVIPLINKENTHERLLAGNRWIADYWPNAAQVQKLNFETRNYKLKFDVLFIVEKVLYVLQRAYMRRKITREVVTPTRAFFHPFNWSTKMTRELKRRGVEDLLLLPIDKV